MRKIVDKQAVEIEINSQNNKIEFRGVMSQCLILLQAVDVLSDASIKSNKRFGDSLEKCTSIEKKVEQLSQDTATKMEQVKNIFEELQTSFRSEQQQHSQQKKEQIEVDSTPHTVSKTIGTNTGLLDIELESAAKKTNIPYKEQTENNSYRSRPTNYHNNRYSQQKQQQKQKQQHQKLQNWQYQQQEFKNKKYPQRQQYQQLMTKQLQPNQYQHSYSDSLYPTLPYPPKETPPAPYPEYGFLPYPPQDTFPAPDSANMMLPYPPQETFPVYYNKNPSEYDSRYNVPVSNRWNHLNAQGNW